MKAAIVQSDFTLKIEEYPTPKPGSGQVLIKVAYCGICGSDIHFLAAKMIPEGCIMGHELSGYVEEIGEGVEGWKKGDPVAVYPADPCGLCDPCLQARAHLCEKNFERGYGLGANPGAFAEYMLTESSMLHRAPEDVDIKTVALNEPWAVAVHGVRISDFKIGQTALVMGAGPIGLLCIYALKHAGASYILVSEPDPNRAKLALSAGADKVLHPEKDFPLMETAKIKGKLPDFVFECAGMATTMEEAGALCGPKGQVVMMGIYQDYVSTFPLTWFMKELTVIFSLGSEIRDFRESLYLLSKKAVDENVMISKVVPLSKIKEAFEALEKPGHTKILIDCQGV